MLNTLLVNYKWEETKVYGNKTISNFLKWNAAIVHVQGRINHTDLTQDYKSDKICPYT